MPLPLVQELAGVGSPDVPPRYVARGDDEPPVAAGVAPVPVIDLARLRRPPPDGEDEAARLRQAIDSWGLFLVANHGVEASLMDSMMDAARDFFRLPLEEKNKYTNLIDGEHFQFEGYGNDMVRSEEQILDWTDRLYLKVEPHEERNLALWPTNPESFRDNLHEFSLKYRELKDSLLPVMASLLGLDKDYFVNQFGENASTYARFNYYPMCPKPELVNGMKAHSDGTVLSILMVDNNVGGLQVLRDDIWYNVPTQPHTFLINLGDVTEIVSNGIFKSPVHRVVTNAEKERLSVVLFYIIDPEKEIAPAAELIDGKRPALYKKVKFKDYTAAFFETFSRGTRAIDTQQKWQVPALVQELSATGHEPPHRYVQPEQHRPDAMAAAPPASVPVIDLGRLPLPDDGGGSDEVGKLRRALDSWGLFQVCNHGIETSLMDGLMSASKEFFRQPHQVKQEFGNLIDGNQFRVEGYGNDKVRSKDQILDWSDRINLKVEPEDQRNLALWPNHPIFFRDALHEFTMKCRMVNCSVLRAMARILGLDDDEYFIDQFGDIATVHARFNYYPSCPRPDLVMGMKPHSDGTVITVLLVWDGADGLQVLRDGVWYSVPSSPHTLLINVGESMEVMSNGMFRRPVHRVVTNADKERISLAMFYALDPEEIIEPAAGSVDEKRPALYKGMKAEDFLVGLSQHFSLGTRFVDTLKINP
uniref:Fe2OG dioxygenase domain-containing protein n=1 Tax=Leersia perrieri TaxID=77586 RepID=A0A0D9WM11_9ORYZ